MTKEVIVWSAPAIWPVLHMQTELIIEEIEQKSKVTVVYCAGYQKSCDANPHSSKLLCHLCMKRFDGMINFFKNDEVTFEKIELDDFEISEVDRYIKNLKYNNLNSLKEITIKGDNGEIDLGSSVYSTLLSKYRDPLLDIDKYNDDIKDKFYDAFYNYKFADILMQKKSYNKSIIFNCRIDTYRPIMRLSSQNEIPTYCWDTLDSDCSKLCTINRGAYPHEPIAFSKRMLDIYNNSNHTLIEKETIAKRWFENRINFNDEDTKILCRSMTNDSNLREKYHDYDFICSIFLSSEDEMMTLPDYTIVEYENQYDAVTKTIQYLKSDKIKIIVRIHPNSLDTAYSYYAQYDNLKEINKNVEVIPSDNDLSSYDLLLASDLVITFGSTIGIEACYLKKPSLLIAKNTFYSNLGGTIKVDTDYKVKKILSSIVENYDDIENIFPNDEEKYHAAIIYGYSIHYNGKIPKYITRNKRYYTLKYNNKMLKSGKWILRFFYKIENIYNIVDKIKSKLQKA